MQYRQLGHTGVKVSVIGLGTNQFGSENLPFEEVSRIIQMSLDKGINFIDTANTYQQGRSEEFIGKALKGRRREVVLATKFYFRISDAINEAGCSRYHMMNTVEDSLKHLQTDHIDLYYVHRWDANTPIEETQRALDDLVRAGKVRYVGCSDFAAWQLARANLMAEFRNWSPFIVIQSEYHMFDRGVEREVLPYCRAHKVGFIPYYPLAGGFLTGKYNRNQPPPSGSRGENSSYVKQYMNDFYFDQLDKLSRWANEHNKTLTDLAHAWLLAQPEVSSVISGGTRLEHFETNMNSADWYLTPQDLDEIEAIIGKSVLQPDD
jgi:aryl-alcohol dehydrogenase-like predicted oxidoreductase